MAHNSGLRREGNDAKKSHLPQSAIDNPYMLDFGDR